MSSVVERSHFCGHTWEILRPRAGALFLRCKGTTFALRLTNDSAIIFEIFLHHSHDSQSQNSQIRFGIP